MNYHLGVDLGTTFTAAAVWAEGEIKIVDLGNRATQMPSVVFLDEDGQFVTGEVAERRAHADPSRVAREFKRRVGDTTPFVLGGVPCSADLLTAELLRSVVEVVSKHYGGPPDSVALTHPALWGPYKLDLLKQAGRIAECGDITLVSEPEAAVVQYLSTERVDTGSTVAVYDFGGGTFDAAVVRKTDTGTTILGRVDGLDHLGGVDFDQELLRLVLAQAGGAAEGLDNDDPLVRSSLLRLRQECRDAKEALSAVEAVDVPVLLPDVQFTASVTRPEFDAVVRPALEQTLVALERAISSADLSSADLTAVLLVGGSSRLPLVRQMVGDRVECPIAFDAHPKYVVAMGAARVAAGVDDLGPPTQAEPLAPPPPIVPAPPHPVGDEPSLPPAPEVADSPSVFVEAPTASVPVAAGDDSDATVFNTAPGPVQSETIAPNSFVESAPTDTGRRRLPWVALVVTALVAVGAVIAVVVFRGDDEPADRDATTSGTTPAVDTDSVDPPEVATPTPTLEPDDTPEVALGPIEVPVPLRTIGVGPGPLTPLEVDGSIWVPSSEGDTFSRIDPASGDVETVVVGARPDRGVVANGALWVPARDDGLLARVDLSDNSVTTTPIGLNADTPVFDGQRLWIAVRGTNELIAVDPADGSRIFTVALQGRPLTPILVEGALWFITREDNALHRLDLAPLDGGADPALDTIQVGADPDRPIEAGGMLWVPNRDDATVSVVDLATRAVVSTLAVGDTPDTPVAAGGRVWVPNSRSNTVTVLDVATREVVETIEVGDGPRTGVVAGGSVWFPITNANTLVQLDVDDAVVVDRFLTGAGPGTPAVIGENLWIPNRDNATVLEFQAGDAS